MLKVQEYYTKNKKRKKQEHPNKLKQIRIWAIQKVKRPTNKHKE